MNSPMKHTNLIRDTYGALLDLSRWDSMIDQLDRLLSQESSSAFRRELEEQLEPHFEQACELLGQLDVATLSEHASIIERLMSASHHWLYTDLDRRVIETSDSMTQHKSDTLEQASLHTTSNTNESMQVVALKSQVGTTHLLHRVMERDGYIYYLGLDDVWNQQLSSRLQELFGFSQTELDVCKHLFDGQVPKQISTLRGRSLDTVRSQVKSIQKKAGVSSIADFRVIMLGLNKLNSGLNQPPSVRNPLTLQLIQLPNGLELDVLIAANRPLHETTPILFLHGCQGGREFLPEFYETIFNAGYSLIAPARPGNGQSLFNAQHAGVDQFARDMSLLADALSLQSCIVVGYDAGSIYALRFSELYPQLVKKLLLVSPFLPSDFTDNEHMPVQQKLYLQMARFSPSTLKFMSILGDSKIRREGKSKFARTVFRSSTADIQALADEQNLNLYWRAHHFHVENGNDGFISNIQCIATFNSLVKVSHPECKVVHGDKDASVSIEAVKQFCERHQIPLIEVKGAGRTLGMLSPENWLSCIE